MTTKKRLKTEIVLKSLKDVVATFQPSHKYWASYYPEAWIFRGHALEDWLLRPAVFREDVCKKYGLKFDDGIRLDFMVEAEFELLLDFTHLCDRVGLQLPEQAYTYIMNPEVRQFSPEKEPEGYQNFPSIELQHIMALAQHNKLPTRLLDFSYDPLAALFFAAEPPKCGSKGNQYFVVYAINRLNLQAVGRYKEIHTPSYTNDNLRSQKGLFLLDKDAHVSLSLGKYPPDMESVLASEFERKYNRDKKILLDIKNDFYVYRKIKIPEDLRGSVLKHLHKCHYNRAHMFPSYESVSETVRVLSHLQPAARFRTATGSYH